MTVNLQEKEKKSYTKEIIIVLLSFLFIPIMTISIMYFTNENFKYSTNNLFSLLPGRVGSYFKSLPTKQDKENIKLQIAKHYINLDEDRLVDKLLIIKGEDRKLYDDLLVLLNRENPMKMRNVNNQLRNIQVKSNLLNRIMEEIKQDKDREIQEIVDYYSSLKIADAVLEIERTYRSGQLKEEILPVVFANLPIELSANILIHLEEELAQRVAYNLKGKSKQDIEKKMTEIENRQKELIKTAKIYENKPLDEKLEDLGTINKFSPQDLAVIYKHMGVKSGGQILALVEDNDFITTLYENINHLEKLYRDNVGLAAKLAEAMQIYKNYNAKVKELATIYERMSLQELNNIIEEMVKSNQNYQSYVIGDEEIVFTEVELVLDILNHFRPNKAAQLLEQLNTTISIDLSKRYVVVR